MNQLSPRGIRFIKLSIMLAAMGIIGGSALAGREFKAMAMIHTPVHQQVERFNSAADSFRNR